jgi:hypothetical protein
MVMKDQTVEIYIDELVLHGFPLRDKYHIGSAIEKELTRLFNEQGVPSLFHRGGNISFLDGGRIKMAKSERGESTGSSIAGSVFSSFTGNAGKQK